MLVLEWVEPGDPDRGGGRARSGGSWPPPTGPGADGVRRALARLHRRAAARTTRTRRAWAGVVRRAAPRARTCAWPADRGALTAADVAGSSGSSPRSSDYGRRSEPPSRIHGDLWPGNVLWGADGRAWLVDPAAHGGHRETDLAQLALFGGAAAPRPDPRRLPGGLAAWRDGWRARVPLHQLHLLLVHAALFGGAYRASVLASARAARSGRDRPGMIVMMRSPRQALGSRAWRWGGSGRWAGRPVRPRRHRPAGVADRPVQPALHVLHARGGPGLAAQGHTAHRRRGDRGWSGIAVERLGVTEVRFTGGEPLLRPGLVKIIERRLSADAAADAVADHQRHRAGPAGRPAGRRRASTGSTSRWTRCGRTGSSRWPAAPARRRARRARGGRAGGPAPGEAQRGADAGRQRRRGGRPAAVRPRARLRAAVHRADAARRPARLAPREHGRRRGDPGPAASRSTRCCPTRTSGARHRPRPGWSTATSARRRSRPGSA